jgi:hypothetical protein
LGFRGDSFFDPTAGPNGSSDRFAPTNKRVPAPH